MPYPTRSRHPGAALRWGSMTGYLLLVSLAFADPAVLFESGVARPLALADGGATLLVTNLPDGRLERLDPVTGAILDSVPVGLDPVAVAVRGQAAWVVDHGSDAVSVVALGAVPAVTAVLPVGDAPSDVVFAGDRAFVTAARRGTDLPTDPESATPGRPRADVWVFAADPPAVEQVISLFADTPRALAVSPDGSRVYAAAFLSGNRTATVPAHLVCDGGEAAPPCVVDGWDLPGGLPAPNTDRDGVPQPEVGLIVRHDGTAWRDELGRDWSNGVRFEVPDLDVFALDALATPVAEVEAWSGVGTVVYAMATDPATGELLAVGTEARNEVRFSGLGGFGGDTVRGHLHEARVTRLSSGQAARPVHLNPHLDYAVVPSPPDAAAASLAQPVAVAVGPEGQVWIAGYGSAAVAVHALDELEPGTLSATPARLVPTLGGPAGVLIDGPARRVFVYARFANAVQAFDLDSHELLWTTALHDPEPPEWSAGRAAFHDARAGSSNGEASCGVCHVFGHDDGLAWDLGDPDRAVEPNPNPVLEGDTTSQALDFHPLKGPMHTQTLRGIADSGPLHWRGDRNGGRLPGDPPTDPAVALLAFAEAFHTLQGAAAPADPATMEAIAAWATAITPPPNPYLPLDGVRTPAQQAAWDAFAGSDCIGCHVVDPALGHWGTDGSVAANSNAVQFMKVPSLRQTYTKLGLFWTGSEPRIPGPGDPLGPQVKAFGFFHDGATGALPDDVREAVLAFPTNLAPAVGEQVVVGPGSSGAARDRLDALVARSDAGDCDLVAHAGPRGWWWVDGAWQSDLGGGSTTDDLVAAGPVRVLCAPPGLGARLALDRDGDGVPNGQDVCEGVEDPMQRDADADGLGDRCDPSPRGGAAAPEPPEPEDTGDPAEAPRGAEGTRSCGCANGARLPALALLIPLGWRRRRRVAANSGSAKLAARPVLLDEPALYATRPPR